MSSGDTLALLQRLVQGARAAGADAADAILVEGVSVGASMRFGKLEELERSEGQDVGLRVFIGQRQASVSATDLKPESLESLPARAVAMARHAPEDSYCGLAPQDRLARSFPSLDLEDSEEPSSEALIAAARDCEAAALAVQGITNSEGGSASWGRSGVTLVTSHGFAGAYAGTSASISCSVVAGEGTGMERDYEYAQARFTRDLDAPETIGRQAAEKALARLHPRKAKSQPVPVVYDPRVSASLVGHLAGATNGASVARGTSFLKAKMGQRIFPAGLSIIDDPHRKRGLRSKPFDGEGVANARTAIVEDGVLRSWFLDCASARQLGLSTTGHAARGTSGPPGPSPTNLYMAAGAVTPAELMADISQGFYVTELIGMGVNGVTGDYSRGASGFWIENGQIAYPVNEVTIAGTLQEMFLHLTPANDLVFRYGTNAPTIRVEGMIVAGS
ncbi:MAG: TldD/PmbA family protein [Alphaproteobacteria bacterium]|nr:TldD/PmbA family protein [Alphaproteobacteria bacterium]